MIYHKEFIMLEKIYVIQKPNTEAMLDTYYEMEPATPKSSWTFLDRLRNWIHELRDFIVSPPPPREQVHVLVAPSLTGVWTGNKPSPKQGSQR